jgi:hypothetical protein
MSVSPETVPQPTGPTSPAEYVRSLSPEDKEAIFTELVREAIRLTGGKALIPVRAPDGEQLGYYVPPEAAAEQLRRVGPHLTAEDRERTRRALADLGKTFDMAEYLDELSREDEAPG